MLRICLVSTVHWRVM